ncbi:MAG: CBS domain-containing protein, partial [Rhodospirillaceae bacterium]|nr:CBS domain-containing protein [Rhodospirillaceae bacterium]
LIDESDLLQRGLANPDMNGNFGDPVSGAMTTRLETLPPGASLADVKATFDKGFVALIRDESQYWGLVTRTDLLNWLRRNRPAA